MKLLRRLLWVALFAGAVYVLQRFSSANEAPATIDLLLRAPLEIALWIALLVAFAAGAVCAGLLCFYELAKQGLIARRYRKQVDQLEAEVHQLRTLPLGEGKGADDRSPVTALPPEAIGETSGSS